MQKIDNYNELQSTIQELEKKQKEDFSNLKDEIIDIGENLKPVNLVKEGFNQAFHSPVVKKVLIVAGTSIVTGILVHKLVSGKKSHSNFTSQNNFKNILSRQVKQASFSLFQYVLAAVISQNTDKLKQIANSLLSKKQKEPVHETDMSGQYGAK